MKIKNYLQQLQKLIPTALLERSQYIHSSLLIRWILWRGNQKSTFSQKSAMVFSPHQDDETFGCGGMIADKREQGIPVFIVFLTDGRNSVKPDAQGKTKIIQTRKQEAIKALHILGVETSAIHFLDKQDGSLRDLNLTERQEAIAQISQLIQHYQPEEIYVPHKKDAHRDHEATFNLVTDAIQQTEMPVELYQYPIWLFWRSPLFLMLKLSDIAAAYCFSIIPVQDKKKRAIASYTSQIHSLPNNFVKRFFSPYEIFFKVKS